MQSARRTSFHLKLLLAATTIILSWSSTSIIQIQAFSPEIFNQVIAQLGSLAETTQICPDSLAFAAANLIDPTQQQQQQRNSLSNLLKKPFGRSNSNTGADGDDDENETDGDGRKSGGLMQMKLLNTLLLPPIYDSDAADIEDISRGRTYGSGVIQLPKLPPSIVGIYNFYNNVQSVAAATASPAAVSGSLDLTPQEEELINLIWKVRCEYSPSTTIRIAGGWVRDKLIYGKDTPSRDIDLVLSNCSGKDFAQFVCKYVEEDESRMRRVDGSENAPAGANNDDDNDNDLSGSIMDIQQPSSTSKGAQADQLQTATLYINGFDVDFCRLRSERYDKESRIPVSTGVASVVEDAWRRDLTINALYYNIGSNQVEDFTEVGLRDLILQIINTPKKALPTLVQDPIRILRAVRFAAQLSFDISPELLRAAQDERVRSALELKVSRDAIGKAIDEMLSTRARDPSRGISLLMTTNLVDVVFPLGEQYDPTIYRVGLEYLSRTQSLVTRIFLQSPQLSWDIAKRRLLWYAAFLRPVYELTSSKISSIKGSKRKRQESTFYQLLDSLKRPKTDVQSIESILKGVKPIQQILFDPGNSVAIQTAIKSGACIAYDASRTDTPQWEELSELRWKMYKTLKPVGVMWKEAVILALSSSQKNVDDCASLFKDLVFLVEEQLHLKSLLLDGNKPRPLLNGSEIQQKALHGQINGKDFRRIVEAMEEWQIRHVCNDLERDDSRDHVEAQLIGYLVATFPEYANDTSMQ